MERTQVRICMSAKATRLVPLLATGPYVTELQSAS